MSSCGYERFELGLLDRFIVAWGPALLAGLDLAKDVGVGQVPQGVGHGRLALALPGQFFDVLEVLQVVLPNLVDGLGDDCVAVGQGDRAHGLGEVGVAGGADQESIRLVARLLHAWSEPGLPAVASAEGVDLGRGRVVSLSLGLACAADPHFGEVAAGPEFVDPEFAAAGG